MKLFLMPYILFSGHMIDKPGRPVPRFPPEMEDAAAAAIRSAVREVVGGDGQAEVSTDGYSGIAAAACGGDILFHEACQELGVPSEIYLGIPIDEFEKTSVEFAGEGWVRRYRKLVGQLPVHVLFPEAKADVGDEVWEKANEWMVAVASHDGGDAMSLIVLWDGEGGDGPGGTRHMVETAGELGADITIIGTDLL